LADTSFASLSSQITCSAGEQPSALCLDPRHGRGEILIVSRGAQGWGWASAIAAQWAGNRSTLTRESRGDCESRAVWRRPFRYLSKNPNMYCWAILKL